MTQPFDEAAFITGRLLRLAQAVIADGAADDTREELADLCHVVSGGSHTPQGTAAARLGLGVACSVAQKALAASMRRVETGPIKAVSPESVKGKEQLPNEGSGDAAVRPSAQRRSAGGDPSGPESLAAAKESELRKIGEIVAAMRGRADHLRGCVKASDATVASAAAKMAKVVQDVSATDAALQRSGGRLGGSFIERQLRRIPLIGPAVLAPLAGIIAQALVLLCVIAMTVATVAAMLMLPRARIVYVERVVNAVVAGGGGAADAF